MMWSLTRLIQSDGFEAGGGECCNNRKDGGQAIRIRGGGASPLRRLTGISLGYCIVFNYMLLCLGRYMSEGEAKSMNSICRVEGELAYYWK